ncbi:hypothetical protein K438DRAFT_2018596 [Mycena galopus ATCC 62051]|nr:hypothetical protein K438DRAFT_2018596 [Mycena galopus ATCC 62051]
MRLHSVILVPVSFSPRSAALRPLSKKDEEEFDHHHHVSSLLDFNETAESLSHQPTPQLYLTIDWEDSDQDETRHPGLIITHAVLMSLAFFVFLPMGITMRSLKHSLHSLAVSGFYASFVLACAVSSVYRKLTPDITLVVALGLTFIDILGPIQRLTVTFIRSPDYFTLKGITCALLGREDSDKSAQNTSLFDLISIPNAEGGLFWCYGLVCFARFLGWCSERGWSWNRAPCSGYPTAEMIESTVIFLYGATNTWMERFGANPGDPFTTKQIQHIGIAVMFWFAGLVGMAIESKNLRKWLAALAVVGRYGQHEQRTPLDLDCVRVRLEYSLSVQFPTGYGLFEPLLTTTSTRPYTERTQIPGELVFNNSRRAHHDFFLHILSRDPMDPMAATSPSNPFQANTQYQWPPNPVRYDQNVVPGSQSAPPGISCPPRVPSPYQSATPAHNAFPGHPYMPRFVTPAPPSSQPLFHQPQPQQHFYPPPVAPPPHQAPPVFYHHAPMYQPQFVHPMASVSQPHIGNLGPVPKAFALPTQWADGNKLSLERGNWIAWESTVKHQLGVQPGALRFLGRSNPCPSPTLYPAHYRAWVDADTVIQFYLSGACVSTEREHFKSCTTAAAIWDTLRKRHEHRGPKGQVKALHQFLSTDFASDPTTFAATIEEMTNLNTAIWAAGPIDPDSFLLVGLLAALARSHTDFLRNMLSTPNLDLATLKDNLRNVNEFDGITRGRNGSANTAQGAPEQRKRCTMVGCPRPDTHQWKYCMYTGGGMAGKGIREAQAKRRADSGKPDAPEADSQTKPRDNGNAKSTRGGSK